MFKGLKMTYDVIRKKMGASIDKSVGESIRRYSADELREACLDENKAKELASRAFHHLPERIKSSLDSEGESRFVEDVTRRLMKAVETKKGKKKILGE